MYVQTCPNGDGGEAKLLGKTFGIGMDADMPSVVTSSENRDVNGSDKMRVE